MKVRISQMFHDKADYTKVYLVGETYTFDDERAIGLVQRGLVEEVIEVKAEPKVIEKAEEPIELFTATEKAAKPVTVKRKSTPKDK